MAVTRTIGRAIVVALEDGAGRFFEPRKTAFPTATEDHWRRADALDPGAAGVDGGWWLRFRCFAIVTGAGRTMLVDAGIGPADAPAARWAPVPGKLPDELAAAGIAPDDVDTVVLTHLHTDHIGWAVTDSAPYFRNATYLLQRADHDAVATLNPSLRERLLEPLRGSGQLSLLDGDTTLAAGVRVVATPGHTPGHQSVLVEAGGEPVVITGDLLVHAVQLVDPELAYAHDVDPDQAARSRVALLTAQPGLLATAHLTEPFLAR
jgi:glyoxylase-like metal-dependent hydrolase (beta-lactamase superfamily II)